MKIMNYPNLWENIQKLLAKYDTYHHDMMLEPIVVKADGGDFLTNLTLNCFLMKDWADEEGDESEQYKSESSGT